MMEPRQGIENSMGKYGIWLLYEQLDQQTWFAKRADGVKATILFIPGMEPGFDPKTTPSPVAD